MQKSHSLLYTNDDSPFPSSANWESTTEHAKVAQSNSHFDECIHILEKRNSERTAHDADTIASTLKQFEYFSKQTNHKNDHSLLEFAKTINYEHFHKDRVIFHKDDINDKIYLILSGSVVIFNQIATDVFKIDAEATEEEKTPEDLLKEVVPVKSLLKRNTIDENFQRDLFKPRMSRKLFRQMTSLGETDSVLNHKIKSQAPPTVEEMKRYLSETHHQTGSHAESQQSLDSLQSPWAAKEAKKKLLLYKLLLKADREKPNKYILDGKFLYDIKKKVKPGSHFGEMNSKLNKFKEATAVATEDLHLISFRVGDYIKFFNQPPSNANYLRFLAPYFPDASYPKLLKLTDLFEECTFKQKNTVYEEDAQVDCLYLIKEGEIQLMKKIDLTKIATKEPLSPSVKKKYNIASMGAGQVFGEDEFFFEEASRQYSAVVTSAEAVLLKLDVEVYKRMTETYKELFSHMKKAAKARKSFHKDQSQNVFNQVATSIQQHDDFKLSLKRMDSVQKHRPTILRKDSLTKIPETNTNHGSTSPTKSRSGSPGNKLKISLALELPQSAMQSKEASPKASTIIKKFLKENHNSSPVSTKSFPVMTEPDKKYSEGGFSPTLDPEDFRKSLNPLQMRSRKADRMKTTNSDMPWADMQLSLYTKALSSHVKKKIPHHASPNRKLKVLTKNSSEHKLYFNELEKSVQSASKIEPKEILPEERGFVSMQGSPIAKLQNRNEIGYNWDSILFHKKNLQSSNSTSQLQNHGGFLALENELAPIKHRLNKNLRVEPRNKLPKFLPEQKSFNKTLKHEGSWFHSPQNLNTSVGGVNHTTEAVPELCKIQLNPDQILSTFESENPNVIDRKGFKPSKVKNTNLKLIPSMHVKNHKMPVVWSKTPKNC